MNNTNPPRRSPSPSRTGPDRCFKCGRAGTTCPECGEVVCERCNVNDVLVDAAYAGHQPADHLIKGPSRDLLDTIVDYQRIKSRLISMKRRLPDLIAIPDDVAELWQMTEGGGVYRFVDGELKKQK